MPNSAEKNRANYNSIYTDKKGNVHNVVDLVGSIATSTEKRRSVHEGEEYAISIDGDIGAGTIQYISLQTGSKQLHFDGIYGGLSAGDIFIRLYENSIVNVLGTDLPPVNMNFASSNVALSVLKRNTTFTDLGNLKVAGFVPATGSGVNVHPASAAVADNRILKANTVYAIEIENIATLGSISYGLTFEFHESDIVLGD